MEGALENRPVWAEIDLDALDGNMEKIRSMIKERVLILAIVKANAYGHGAVEVSKELLRHGADWLGVACVEEAMELRRAGISSRILVVGPTFGYQAHDIVSFDITPSVFHVDDACAFSEEAVRQHESVRIHIAVDSGMGRIGYQPTAAAICEIKKINELPNLIVEGIFTHFALSDSCDKTYTCEQFAAFAQLCSHLEKEGICFSIRHCGSSPVSLEMPEFHCDMVRPGMIVYGFQPSPEVMDIEPLGLRQVLSLKCRITHIKRIEAGDGISYGHIFVADRPRLIASLPVGYADGLARGLSNRMQVLVHGKRVPQVGRICMDQCMIDVTDVPQVELMDEVVLYGYQGNAFIPLSELADTMGTIVNELACNISRRVPRLYVRQGKVVKRTDYL